MEKEQKPIMGEAKITRVEPEDGFVPDKIIRGHRPGRIHEPILFYGKATKMSFQTSDFKVQKIFIRFITGFFLLVALIFFATGSFLLPGILAVSAILIYKKMMPEIEKQAKDRDIPLPETKEEIREVQRELGGQMAHALKDSAKETFTDGAVKDFKKIGYPVYAAICIPVTLGLFCVSRGMGIVFGMLSLLVGIGYHFFLKWLVKVSQK